MNEAWNNEVKVNFTTVTVPILYTPNNGVKIFLAGSIDPDNDNHWRNLIQKYIKGYWFDAEDNNDSITIYSPRRDEDWSDDFETEQATWDVAMMKSADYIIMHLTGESVSPVSLLELGLFLSNDKMFVTIDDDYVRKHIADLHVSCYGYNTISKSLYHTVERIKNNWNNRTR